MITIDNRSPFDFIKILTDAYTSSGSASSDIVDSQNYSAITFYAKGLSVDDTFSLFESDNSDMSDSTEIVDGDKRLNGALADLTLYTASISGVTLNRLGVCSMKRYLQMVGTSTGTSGLVLLFVVSESTLAPRTNS